jgi:heme O synthase-like polyprenyltransferase
MDMDINISRTHTRTWTTDNLKVKAQQLFSLILFLNPIAITYFKSNVASPIVLVRYKY